MPVLASNLRKSLEAAVKTARRAAEKGARAVLGSLAVDEAEAHAGMDAGQKALRKRLRSHGRQLGDERDERRGTQSVERLVSECAYEHWHRLLFSRFLAENGLLIEPEHGVAISLAECRDLARGRGVDPLVLASSFAQRMLPQIFRTGDPVLDVQLPPETRQELERLVEALAPDVFTADDSLGWTYQFWQADRKQEVNDSGVKIGARELPAVTQLFTEDYMVLFLLHNTLGAWWTAKRKAEGRSSQLPGYEWTYLRLLNDGSPAAGTFEGWPKAAKDVKVLDPCMGSGHFLVFALPILVGFRMEEEGLSREDAVNAVLRDNLYGLEIDPRCTQIAAFGLALVAWRALGGFKQLPRFNLGCSGLAPAGTAGEWKALARGVPRNEEALKELHEAFNRSPILGSLVDPARVGGTVFTADLSKVAESLAEALARDESEEALSEMAVAARGLLFAAGVLSGRSFTLVATNVPYLGHARQSPELASLCESAYPRSHIDVATCFLERGLAFAAPGGTVAAVTPHSWLYLHGFRHLRKHLLQRTLWSFLVYLGPRAFQTISGERVDVSLVAVSNPRKESRIEEFADHAFAALTVAKEVDANRKASALTTYALARIRQGSALANPDHAVALEDVSRERLGTMASCYQGLSTGDAPRLLMKFVEFTAIRGRWQPIQGPPEATQLFAGRDQVVDFATLEAGFESSALRGREAWQKIGVAIGQMSDLPATLYTGEYFTSSAPVVVARDSTDLTTLWSFLSSAEFSLQLRKINPKLSVDNGYVSKVPFDSENWRARAAAAFPTGLPRASSADPTQWLFPGSPLEAEAASAIQVAVARLVGYRWPRQTGSSFSDCPALGPDGLEKFADDDGIVCLPALKGEAAAAARLRDLLAAAFGKDWSAAKQAELLAKAGSPGESLEDWLQDSFFEQHCELFHQRPFVWHIWDGIKKGGFSALVNYHKLAGPDGEGRRTLDALIYSYLGEWIAQQRAAQKAGAEGADACVAAAEHLKKELLKIVEGEPPYDIFVRWKPLHGQAIGWEPDINDGVRLNSRPFLSATLLKGGRAGAGVLRVKPKGIKWEKDRGTEPERPKDEYPWFWTWDGKTEDFEGGRKFDGARWNDLHYTRKAKKAARDRAKAQRRGRAS